MAATLQVKIRRALSHSAVPFAGICYRSVKDEYPILNATPEKIDAILLPLVQDQTLRRGPSADNAALYEWDGNNARVMCLLMPVTATDASG